MYVTQIPTGGYLILGKNNLGNPEGESEDIVWQKLGFANNFIAKDTLDIMVFDEPELDNSICLDYKYSGNPEYTLSCIAQYLVRKDKVWRESTHKYDYPIPQRPCGFLNAFTEEEIGSLSSIGLPSLGDMSLPLFSRRISGIRPHPSELLSQKAHIDKGSFTTFWLQSYETGKSSVWCIDKRGQKALSFPSKPQGLRPKCNVKPGTQVEQISDNTYVVIGHNTSVFTDEELLKLLYS